MYHDEEEMQNTMSVSVKFVGDEVAGSINQSFISMLQQAPLAVALSVVPVEANIP